MLILPHNFEPREYQKPFWNAMKKVKRACKVWHRRAGKDKTDLNFTIKEMAKRIGQYYYYYPTMAYGRKALWEGMDKAGFPYLQHFPKQFIAQKNDNEMWIRAVNGSLFRIIGTDRLEVVGPNPVGCVFSEYSIQHPKGWEYVRPILAENDGWAVFNFTPRGKNHGYRLYRMAQTNPEWFCECLTVDDTKAITKEAIDAERRSGMSERLIKQEFYCSFEGGQEGSFYGDVLNTLYEQGRVTNELKFNAGLPVHTVCDPGYHWPWIFFQIRGGGEPVFLRAYEEIGLGVEKHAEILEGFRKQYGYRYGQHFAPIDTEKNNAYRATAGKSLNEHAKENGINFTILPPEYRVMDGIERTRHFLFGCWFIKDDCELLLDALEDYSAQRIERISTEMQPIYVDAPATSWSNHIADAMRYASMAVKRASPDVQVREEYQRLKTVYA